MSRPQLTAMRLRLRKGDTVVCHSMDSTRRNFDGGSTTARSGPDRTGRLGSVYKREPDLYGRNPEGESSSAAVCAFAQFERELVP